MMRQAAPVLGRLNEAGFEAYYVGGCVRDAALGRPVSDVDIATSAQPEQVAALFARTLPTGLQHGTVTVLEGGRAYEVTTFRKESVYERHRRPSEVAFIADLRGDLQRRDFTINAMAMDISGDIVDPFGGRADLQDGIIRCVGDADLRLQEDALRLLRGVRFASVLGYRIAKSTWRAIVRHRKLLRHIAMERVGVELDKMLGGPFPNRALELLERSGLWRETKLSPVGERFNVRCRRDAQDWSGVADTDNRWAGVLLAAGIAPDAARSWLGAFGFGKARVGAIMNRMGLHKEAVESDETGEALRSRPLWTALVLRYGRDDAEAWLSLIGQAPGLAEGLLDEAGAARLAEWTRAMPAATLKELAVNGRDLKALAGTGKQGPWISALLNELLAACARGDVPNEKQALLSSARTLLRNAKELS
ncbi:CCA tRNA nucleotidyltransferase [uncultured Paenibacillus sp.]|uniref:CCA tRNA nucleotidyltransferase n=1 Tax=uncultured Paenibacillus sp. TaxID=227322 RepID=UPI0028D44AFC|nr:CCA tRNA nucleotidyltransferase [uncultured Paenibacillus sp.]